MLEPSAEVVDMASQKEVQAAHRLEKVIQEFMGGLYDQARIIERGQEGLEEGVRGFFKGGLALFILERHEGVASMRQILEQYFPAITRSTAYRYMKVAKAMAAHPAFRSVAYERGGYTKALALLESCTEEEIQESGGGRRGGPVRRNYRPRERGRPGGSFGGCRAARANRPGHWDMVSPRNSWGGHGASGLSPGRRCSPDRLRAAQRAGADYAPGNSHFDNR